MPPFLTKYLIIGIVSLLAIGAAYLKGRSDVNELREADQAAWQAKYDLQVAETARIEKERDAISLEIENELKPKLAAVSADAVSLARRLRLAARSSPVSTPTDPTPILNGTIGGGGGACTFADGVGQALENYFGASARDSARLDAWIAFYRQLQDASNP